jgi:hypothetical protein
MVRKPPVRDLLMKKPSRTAAELEASIKVELEEICDLPTDMTISVQPEVRNRNEHQPHAKRPRRASLQSQIKTNREAVSCACGTRLSRLPDAWSRRRCAGGERNGNFRHGGCTKDATDASR